MDLPIIKKYLAELIILIPLVIAVIWRRKLKKEQNNRI